MSPLPQLKHHLAQEPAHRKQAQSDRFLLAVEREEGSGEGTSEQVLMCGRESKQGPRAFSDGGKRVSTDSLESEGARVASSNTMASDPGAPCKEPGSDSSSAISRLSACPWTT